jgi:hypothetical protein
MQEHEIHQSRNRGAPTKEPAATQASSLRFGTFDICAMMNSEAVLDDSEIRPRLIRLAQRQIVFRWRPSQPSHGVSARSRHSRCARRFSSASTRSLSRS